MPFEFYPIFAGQGSVTRSRTRIKKVVREVPTNNTFPTTRLN
ncbi:MAG: hypothetical protein VKJ02_11510 [Snowella sp.]|nr:hypothetical protein [Snowella sp.]